MTTTPAAPEGATPGRINIVLFPDVEELDAVGPWEVLAWWTRTYPQDGWSVSCISRDGRPVRCAKGLVIEAHCSFADAPIPQVLLHPGGTAPGPSPKTRDTWTGCENSAAGCR